LANNSPTYPTSCSTYFPTLCRFSVYFVMDMRTGGDLRYYLKKKHIFEEKDVAFYVACLSSALMHIHSKNIIHRDIKPGE
jgi:serine/threonine protein kinase